MKKLITKSILVFAIAIAAIACKKEKATTTKEAAKVTAVAAAQKYGINKSASKVNWEAHKLVGGHSGTIDVTNGVFEVKDGKLVGGNFILDINSIGVTDVPVEDANNAKIVGHLKNEDFFNVGKFPNAAFQITNVSEEDGKTKVAGNLSIKGIKKNIEFFAATEIEGNSLSFSSETFAIDRTLWGVNHNSGKFADAAKLGDYLIKDNVDLKVVASGNLK